MHGAVPVVALFEQAAVLQLVHRPEDGRQQEGDSDGFVGGDAFVGVGERDAHHVFGVLGVGGVRVMDGFFGVGKERFKEAVLLQDVKAGLAVAAHKEFLYFVKEAGGGDGAQVVATGDDGGFGIGFKRHVEFGGEAGGAQHAHRVFGVTRHGVADNADDAAVDVIQRADVVADFVVFAVVVEGVDGEIATDDIVFEGAVVVVFEDGAVAVGAGFALRRGAKGGDFNDVAAKVDMRQAETAADKATVAENAGDLFGTGVGGDVEVFRLFAEQQVADASADEIGFESGFVQLAQDFQGARVNLLFVNRVFAVFANHGRCCG